MAVLDPKKLLPSSTKQSNKSIGGVKPVRFLVPAKNVQYKNTAELSPTESAVDSGDNIKEDIIVIKTKVISIEDLLKKSLKIQEKKLDNARKQLENTGRKKKENFLEKQLKDDKKKKEIPGLPKFGFLDAIKNFITSTLLGFIFFRLVKYLPQMLEFGKKIAPVVTFIESFIGGMADKLITFIQFGYDVYDKVRGVVKNLGGENAQKTFDEFSSKLNTFINLAIIAGMATMGGTDFGLGKNGKPKGGIPGGNKPGTTPSPKPNNRLREYLNRGKEAKLLEKKFGNSAARYYEELRSSGKNSVQAFAEVKKRFKPRGLFNRQTVSGLAGSGQTAGRVGRRGLGRVATRAAAKTFGKGGAKIVSGATRGLGKVPIVGPLIDLAFRYYILREPIGKAIAGAAGAAAGQSIGAWVGGSIGGIAGSVVPIVGNLIAGAAGATIGGLIGGLIGDQIGVSLYETFASQGNQSKEKVEKRAGGGQITRGGRPTGGRINRTLRVTRRTIKPQKLKAPKLTPGKDIGGQRVIEKIFNPEERNKPNQISALRTLSKVSGILKTSKQNMFSQVAAIGVDLAMGQEPSRMFVKKFGASLGSIFQELVDTNAELTARETARSIFALANGGMVPDSMVTRGGNFGKKVGDSISEMFQSFINSQSDLIITLLKQESEKDPFGGNGGGGGNGDNPTPMGDIEYGPLPLDMTQKQAFATIYELAKKVGASMPELVAGMAMNESGYLKSTLARQANNPFGQTGSGTKGSMKIPGNSRTFAVYNSLEDAIKFHVKNWNNDSKHGKGAGSYGSPVAGLQAILPVYDPGGNHAQYIKNVSSILATMGFDPTKKNSAVDLSSSRLIQARRPGRSGIIAPDNTPLGSTPGNLTEAKSLAASMGLQMTSAAYWSDGRRRSGLHGAGRAMDFSNDGVGNGTPEQLSFAKELIKRYGSKLEQLIYTPLGYGIAKGKRVGLDYWGDKTNSQHYNHVHVAFKRGGYTGSGGVGRLHSNEMVMNSNAVNFFGRNTFEAMNAIGDRTAKLAQNKNFKSYKNLNTQASYEKHGETTIMILPINKNMGTPPPSSSGGGAPFNLGTGSNVIDNSIEAALA